MKQTYTFYEISRKNNGSILNKRKREVDFYSANNEIQHLNEDPTGWQLTEGVVTGSDKGNLVLPDTKSSLVVSFQGKFTETPPEHIELTRELEGLEPNTKYFMTVYVRNNAVSSSQLRVGEELQDFSVIHYTQRLGAILETDSEGKAEISIRAYDPKTKPSGFGIPLVWIDGLYATKLDAELEQCTIAELKEIYPYTVGERNFPTQYDIFKDNKTVYSPYRYAIVFEGRRLLEYHKGVDAYGMQDGSEFDIVEVDKPVAIMNAFYNDVPLMSMLEQDKAHVSHAFPKEDEDMAMLGTTHFPRIQYFTGFSVNKQIVEAKPTASEVNYAVNVYIPTFKVMESVNAVMITEQVKGIMADLGWAAIRGSDYFLKKEQLYVLQTQFIQDAQIVRR